MAAAYYEVIAKLPRPSREQTERFAQYVASAHSWHKHLPPFPPGFPFVFFLDPHAGQQLVMQNGREFYEDRIDDGKAHHYSWMPTAQYRQRFGFWQYFCDRPERYLKPGIDILKLELASGAQVMDHAGRWIPVARDVIKAGRCLVTGLVHETFNPDLWSIHQPAVDAFIEYSRRYPGLAEVKRMDTVLRWMDVNVEAVAAAERKHQRDNLRAALARAVEIMKPQPKESLP